MNRLNLKLVDQSGPATLAAGKRVYDIHYEGREDIGAIGTIQWSDLGGEYIFVTGASCLNADELLRIASVMVKMEAQDQIKENPYVRNEIERIRSGSDQAGLRP